MKYYYFNVTFVSSFSSSIYYHRAVFMTVPGTAPFPGKPPLLHVVYIVSEEGLKKSPT